MKRLFSILLLFAALVLILSFNAFCAFVKPCFSAIKQKVQYPAPRLLILLLCSLTPACTQQDTEVAKNIAHLGFQTSIIVDQWDSNRDVLQKYYDMLPETDPDRATIAYLIHTGNTMVRELQGLISVNRFPTISYIGLIFSDADRAVRMGEDLYRDNQDKISAVDKYRAKLFADTWQTIRRDVTALKTTDSSGGERYEVAKNLLSIAVMITGQLVIPALKASGKL